MSVEYEYIKMAYTGQSASGKTSTWRIGSKHGDFLGEIKWFGRWRQYTFFPEPDTIYSAGCLADIQDFINRLHELRKREGKATDWPTENDVCSIPACGCTGLAHP